MAMATMAQEISQKVAFAVQNQQIRWTVRRKETFQ